MTEANPCLVISGWPSVAGQLQPLNSKAVL
jgi:hypothetical protein